MMNKEFAEVLTQKVKICTEKSWAAFCRANNISYVRAKYHCLNEAAYSIYLWELRNKYLYTWMTGRREQLNIQNPQDYVLASRNMSRIEKHATYISPAIYQNYVEYKLVPKGEETNAWC